MQTVEIRLNRADGVKVTKITFNGNIQTVGQSVSQPKPERRFLHELTEEERAERETELKVWLSTLQDWIPEEADE